MEPPKGIASMVLAMPGPALDCSHLRSRRTNAAPLRTAVNKSPTRKASSNPDQGALSVRNDSRTMNVPVYATHHANDSRRPWVL